MLALPRPVFEDDSDVVRISSPWYIHQTERYGLLLCFSGGEAQDDRWMIRQKLEPFKVVAVQIGRTRPRELVFDGPLNAAEMALSAATVEQIALFRRGIPDNWTQIWPRPPPPPPPSDQVPIALRRARRITQQQQQQERDADEDNDEKPLPVRRSSRHQQEERPCYDEDDMLLRALRKEEEKDHILDMLGMREEDMTDDDEDDDWTDQERDAFHQARLLLNPSSGDFWKKVSSEFVMTRTASECQERWLRDGAQQRPHSSKQHASSSAAVSEEDAMLKEERAAKMGTVRFRRQVRSDWERAHMVKRQQVTAADLATPFRVRVQNDHLPQSCCKDVFTPVNHFSFGDDKRRLGVVFEDDDDDEEEAMAAPSPDVLVEVNRDNLDGYLIGLVKEKQKMQRRLKPCNNKQARRTGPTTLNRTGATMVESDGIQGTMTPGGTVKLGVLDRAMYTTEDDQENCLPAEDEDE